MTQEQKQVKDWMMAFGQECPEKPCIPSLEVRKLRAKLILEEAVEEITKGLGLDIFIGLGKRDCKLTVHSMIDFIDTGEPNLKEIADGCSDLKVVTEGTLVACGLVKKEQTEYYINKGDAPHICRIDTLFDEVMRSNWTKLWTGKEIQQIFGINGENIEPHCIVGKDHYHDEDNEIKRVIYKDGEERAWLVKDRDGKVIKSPSYSPPNLQSIIDSL